jgi:hypothetical protein
MSGPGRNEPCPCGSGKKYKKCCFVAGSETTYTKGERDAALAALDRFVDGAFWERIASKAEGDFWADLDPARTAIAEDALLESTSELVFDFWLFFDHEYKPGRSVVDDYLDVTQGIAPGVRRYLTLARATTMRVYQVVEVRPGVGMTLRDFVTGEETLVAERSATQQIRRWDVLATRIMPAGLPGDPVLDGSVLPIAPARAEPLVEVMRDSLADDAEEGELSEKQSYAWLVPNIHAAWISPMQLPNLVNYDGDALVLTRVYFDVGDRAAVVAALDGARGLERVEAEGQPPRWAWFGKGKDRKEPVTYGWFELGGERLELQTNSVERGERGRTLVERVGGSAVKYRATGTEDIGQAMQAMRGRPAAEPESLPAALREAGTVAAEQHLAEHYERWLDESVPRLCGQSPRRAAASNDLRTSVVEMLKELEGMYEKALSNGDPAFDPTWMWEELGIGNDRDAPVFRQQAPVLGHETLARHFPELAPLTRDLGARVRRAAGPNGLERVVSEEDLAGDLAYQRFVRASSSPELARHLALTFSNFELYLRKVFWMGESLSWMLGATKLDVTCDAVRLPFRSMALVFIDRYALGLAERADARLPAEVRQGRMLQVLTVYVTQTHGEEGGLGPRVLDLAMVGDVLDGTTPSVVPCRLELHDRKRVDRVIAEASAGVAELDEDEGVRPVYESTPLRDLLGLVVNALLYATSKDAKVDEVKPGRSETRKKSEREVPILTAETVFYLPGTIDIRTLEQLKKARRGGREHTLTRRCMVRGHWRRAQPGWEDQRPRWITPHWRGPSAAAIVERQYRLEE